MSRHALVVRILLLAGVASLVGCGTPWPKAPRIVVLNPGIDPHHSYNILFLPSGYAANEMASFHRAADEMAAEILVTQPFQQHAGHVNFYRMDLTGGKIKEDGCNNPCSATPATLSGDAPWSVYKDGPETANIKINTKLCYRQSVSCLVIFPGAKSQKRALDLARQVPNISSVLVLVNRSMHAGCGVMVGATGGKGLAALAVLTSGNTVDTTAKQTALHELGHAIGLLDEYPQDPVGDPAALRKRFPGNRNLWSPNDPCWDPGESAPDNPKIPWRKLWTSCNDKFDLWSGTILASTPCYWLPVHPAGHDAMSQPLCQVQADGTTKWCIQTCTGNTAQPDGCQCQMTTPPPQTSRGLWEGGFYSRVGYYRGQGACRMNVNSNEFCPVCLRYLNKRLDAFH